MNAPNDSAPPPPEREAEETAAPAQCAGAPEIYVLRLYVAGMKHNSHKAIENIQRICAEHLQGRYELEIIDIYQQPNLAREAQIVAAPTLIKEQPLPVRRIIGDLSQTERILAGLGLDSEIARVLP